MTNASEIAGLERKLLGAARGLESSRAAALRLAAEAARGALGAAPGAPHQVAGKSVAPYLKAEGPNFRTGWKSPAHLVNNATQPHHIEQRDFVGPLSLPGIGFRMYAEHPGTHGKHFFEAGEAPAIEVASDVFARQAKVQLARSFGGS